VEAIGLCLGIPWAIHTNWDYEPMILVIVSGTGLVITNLLLIFKEKNSEPPISKPNEILVIQSESEIKNSTITNITPEKIYNHLDSVPLFQREATASHYVGMNIRCIVKLFSITNLSENKILVTTRDDKYEYLYIDFEIDIDNYPILRIAQRNKRFEVSGKIINCGQYSNRLEVTDIKEV